MDDTSRLYKRYQMAKNGFLPEQVFSLAYLRSCLRDRQLNAAIRLAMGQDMVQAHKEEGTSHGAVTERVQTTRPLPHSGGLRTIPMKTEELIKGGVE